jgi:shikimate kinase
MALGSAETVSLAGMMGSGKSTVARELARLLSRRVVDTDLEVERRAGRPVAAIFEERGEPAFRALERAVVRGIAGPVVVSLGGGAFCDPGNAEHLIRIGRVIFLDVSPAQAARRLGRGPAQVQGRPLAGQWEALLRARLPMYRRAPITVDVDALSPDAVARRIAALLEASR